MKQAPFLKDINFVSHDYLETNPHNAVVYCDPPYAGTTKYVNSEWFNYELFWETMRAWSLDNIVLISERNAPDDFKCIWEKASSFVINAGKQKDTIERLFIHNKTMPMEGLI